MKTRANYALVTANAQLTPPDGALPLEWADDVGDETPAFEFEVPTAEATDAYVGIQAFDVNAYGHEIRINGASLSGFDIPPHEGWQYWVDPITGPTLREGTNTVQIVRDEETDDAFAVGTVTVHWKEPLNDSG